VHEQKEKSSLVWVIPLVIYFLTQTTLAIWWASQTTSAIVNVQAELTEFIADSNTENLRQWTRINENEDSVNEVNSGIAVSNTRLDALKENLARLEAQALETNRLLRELIDR
tara:strand:- start:4948 stop:5283 length:336 start_codon:yes stop_codon:yes gene_type:complete